MKSILVHADDSGAFASRRDSALALARRFGGHVTLLINTPFQRFVSMDPFGGAYIAAEALAEAQAHDATLGARIGADLANEDVAWDIELGDGDLVAVLASAAMLHDLTIVSLAHASSDPVMANPMLAGDVALAARGPVLALPQSSGVLSMDGPVLVAWDGSPEAATALRHAVPLMADRPVTLLRVGTIEGKFPDTAALKYLSRHDVKAELTTLDPGIHSVEEVIDRTAREMGATLLVMGAFGHSRLRETIFGGVTRHVLDRASVPLFLAH